VGGERRRLGYNHRVPETFIEGVIAQTLRVRLRAAEAIWASKGSLVGLDQGVRWQLKLPGGVGGAVRRGFAGEGLALTRIECERDGAEVVLGGTQPGKIEAWDLERDGPLLATRGAFLAGIGDVDIDVTVARRAGAALFGGAGLFLQRLSGSGQVFIHAAGDFLERRLGAGETLTVSTGNLAAFAAGLDYRIRGVGGCRKMMFGGEGVFMTELEGPGRVLMQSLKRHAQARRGPPG
jgi:uncharacterized protein (TIGR00266 family)